MLRRAFILLVLIMMVFGAALKTLAHGANVLAYVTVGPAVSDVNRQAAVIVQLKDAYQSPVEGAKIRVSVGPPGQTVFASATLSEEAPGRHVGEVLLPDTAVVVMRLTVDWNGELTGEIPITLEPGSKGVKDLPVVLIDLNDAKPSGQAPVPSRPVSRIASPLPAGPIGYQIWAWTPMVAGLCLLLVPPALILAFRRNVKMLSREHGRSKAGGKSRRRRR